MSIHVLIADSQAQVRFALRTLLGHQPRLEVVGEATTAEELLAQAERTQPDLVLLHWRLSETGQDVVQTLHQTCPGLRVLVLSARPETRQDALASGADAFVCKMDSPEKLLEAIFGAA
jgi:DNA-binding NarL/FixJ family response regulator